MFSPVQIEILDMMSHVKEESDFRAIRNLISDYFAQKAENAIEQMWNDGKINSQTIEEWKEEDMRTPIKLNYL